jgi:hypothetical protein
MSRQAVEHDRSEASSGSTVKLIALRRRYVSQGTGGRTAPFRV